MIKEFNFILNSNLIINNSTSTTKPHVVFGSDPKLVGSPDYIFQSPTGDFFVVTEKFSFIKEKQHESLFMSDLIKPSSFLESFPDLNLKFGLFLTWYWKTEEKTDYTGTSRKIVIYSYKITEIKKSEQNKNAVTTTNESFRKFKTRKSLEIEGNKNSNPKKCLNCSVVSFCYHRTGSLNEINLPYTILTK